MRKTLCLLLLLGSATGCSVRPHPKKPMAIPPWPPAVEEMCDPGDERFEFLHCGQYMKNHA